MKPVLKYLSVGVGALALPAYIVFAQTPPSPTPTTSSVPYIPLFVHGATSGTATGGGTAGAASTWFIDVAGQQIVACTQAAADGDNGGGAAQTITCNRQPIPPATPTPTPAPTPAPAPAPAGS